MEPKVSGAHANTICMKLGFLDWVRVEAVGFSGGIWVFWNKSSNVKVVATHPQFILLQVQDANRVDWHLAVVYGSPTHHLRRRLWNELTMAKQGFAGPWIAAGLSDFEVGLSKSARLDRVLCNTEWRTAFSAANVTYLPRWSSDHAPILLQVARRTITPQMHSLKFQAAWLTNNSLHEVVKSTWNSNNNFIVNIPRMVDALQRWNKTTFGDIHYRKKIILARLGGVQTRLSVAFHRGLAKLEKKLALEYQEILYQEELLWYQRSRENWITSGDQNTTYYHVATAINRACKTITRLQDDNGDWIMQPTHLRHHVREFFVGLYSEDHMTPRPGNREGGFPHLSDQQWAAFNKTISIEEVHTAVSAMAPFKALGWMVFMQRFINACGMWLAVQSLESVRHFRPISLCNVSYKIITKTITNRLKHILPTIVGPYQSSFVLGRQISDNILVYQEIMHTMHYKKGAKGIMAIKLDFEKAYDRLAWNFIRSTLMEIGFEEKWTRLIMHCVQTPRFSILWNGETLPQFAPTRDIRQGDAMSPALFILCMEVLSQAITTRVSVGAWKGIQGGLGIFRPRPMNLAYMAKLKWRLRTEQDSLWETILNKYAGDRLRSRSNNRSSSISTAWRGIMAAKDIVDAGEMKVVRGELYVKVRDMWEEGVGWRWDIIQGSLPDEMESRLHAFVPSENPDLEDQVGWSLDPTGEFSISTAYESIIQSTTTTNPDDWNRIWKLKVPHRVFMCILLYSYVH
nr:ribonuclease H [Ipomoea batatas]